MADERIHILRDILLELHNGASPESVQERFDATFTGVSAIEISLMEHELMNSDSGVTFEDVMELCDVHANLFKNAVKGVEVEDTEHPGHPVRVFKDENLALRAALIRVRRLLDTYESMEDEEMLAEMRKGLVRQMGSTVTTSARKNSSFLSWSVMDMIRLQKSCGESMTRLGNSIKKPWGQLGHYQKHPLVL